MIDLSPSDRRTLRARAHALHPVVAIGHQGLTPAVVREIDVALRAHELIKIRVHDDDRDARESMLARVCEELGAAAVQHLGKLLIVFRPKPERSAGPTPQRPSDAKKKPSGTARRKPRATHAGDKRAPASARNRGPRSSRQVLGRVSGDTTIGASGTRRGLSRSLTGARSSELTPKPASAHAPRRRRRVLVMAATQSSGAHSEPTVRRRRKNP